MIFPSSDFFFLRVLNKNSAARMPAAEVCYQFYRGRGIVFWVWFVEKMPIKLAVLAIEKGGVADIFCFCSHLKQRLFYMLYFCIEKH
jgi:hypothetical protein